ncbi:hypothetical protein H010_10346 [Hydrogenophaga taeniospiralis CCUG 15921]|uniref:Uncharacterized protein n=2 Tax=Hydrogenophaga TaxID=47420 RepID=A0A9X4NQ64_9BURK|nr:hypothetical protein [Hydrogenophaga taeniospiralis CCUG 15921]
MPGTVRAPGAGIKFGEKTPKEPSNPTRTIMRHTALTLGLLIMASLLAGCDALGIETATQVNARKEAEARAIGSACRYAVRGIEECFASNPKAGKAAVFAGWKDMDQYMRDNAVVGMPNTPGPSRAEPEVIEEIETPSNKAAPRSRNS